MRRPAHSKVRGGSTRSMPKRSASRVSLSRSGQIVVPEDAEQGNLEFGEALQDFGLGDVARVNDSFHRSGTKELNDAIDVGQLIMSVSYDADSHQLILTHSGSPLCGPLCWRSADPSSRDETGVFPYVRCCSPLF